MSSILAIQADRTSLRDFLPAFVVAMVTAAGLLLATATVEPKQTTVAVVFAPWLDADEVLGRIWQSDGRLVRFGNFENVIVADFADTQGLETVRNLGGFVIDPVLVAGCGLIAK